MVGLERKSYTTPMFHPEEIIFAPTGQCNLHCLHCRVARPATRLEIGPAIAFLEGCSELGIDRLGFSGGEPFLEPDFLIEVSRAAVEKGMVFDRLMTNAVWYRDEGKLDEILRSLFEAGFDGQFGLSVDSWHPQEEARLLGFVDAVFRIWGRKDCVDILSVQAPDEGPGLAKLEALARHLGGVLEIEGGEPLAILDHRFDERLAQGEDVAEALAIDIYRFPRSASAEEGAWEAGDWFVDDRCEGPGNVLYVHPDARVAACCGFANEADSLILGRMGVDSPAAMLAKAASLPHIQACYGQGLGELRASLEAGGTQFPGKTGDQCFFCDWLCVQGLIPGLSTPKHEQEN